MDQLPPPYRLIQDELNHGHIIPFLGSGASLGGRGSDMVWKKDSASYLPTAGELAYHLALKATFPTEEPLDLAKVAQYYDIVGGRKLLNQELHDIFNHDYALTPLHTFLADVPAPLLIVTSNYDDLIERAFSAKRRPYHIVIHATDPTMGNHLFWTPPNESTPQKIIPKKLDIDLNTDTVIYKVHGAIDRHEATRDQYVITEDDYIEFLTRMTKNQAIPSIFFEAFNQRNFLFLGYGLRDWNLRVVLSRIGKGLRRSNDSKSWAIQYKPSQLERRFWQERGVEVYDMLIDEFVKNLV